MSVKVPNNLISEAAALREGFMDSSTAALFFTTEVETLLGEADNSQNRALQPRSGDRSQRCACSGEEFSPRERLREFPWNFRPDDWSLITATTAKAQNFSAEELVEADASWQPNPHSRVLVGRRFFGCPLPSENPHILEICGGSRGSEVIQSRGSRPFVNLPNVFRWNRRQ
jgi:hypothetical protein